MATQKTPVSDLQPGMVLAQPLQDNMGRTILPVGGRLTPMTIKRLGKWGIEMVEIETPESLKQKKEEAVEQTGRAVIASATPEDQEFMRRVATDVTRRFKNLDDSPRNKAFRKLTLKYLVLKGRGVVPGL